MDGAVLENVIGDTHRLLAEEVSAEIHRPLGGGPACGVPARFRMLVSKERTQGSFCSRLLGVWK